VRSIRLVNSDGVAPGFGSGSGEQPLVHLRNVSKSYSSGRTSVAALRNVTLSVFEGEMIAIRGRSGAGKTTLLNLIGGLDRPTEGDVVILAGTCGRSMMKH